MAALNNSTSLERATLKPTSFTVTAALGLVLPLPRASAYPRSWPAACCELHQCAYFTATVSSQRWRFSSRYTSTALPTRPLLDSGVPYTGQYFAVTCLVNWLLSAATFSSIPFTHRQLCGSVDARCLDAQSLEPADWLRAWSTGGRVVSQLVHSECIQPLYLLITLCVNTPLW